MSQPPQPAVFQGVHFVDLGRRAGEQRDRPVLAEREVRHRPAARRQLFDGTPADGHPADIDLPIVLDEESQALPVGGPADRVQNRPVELICEDLRGSARRRHDRQLVEIVAREPRFIAPQERDPLAVGAPGGAATVRPRVVCKLDGRRSGLGLDDKEIGIGIVVDVGAALAEEGDAAAVG